MKFGIRTPSLGKSFKNRTTGRVKRTIKRATNPMYGSKGLGYAKNPGKALKNSIYHQTTQGIWDSNTKSAQQNTTATHMPTSDQSNLLNDEIVDELNRYIKFWREMQVSTPALYFEYYRPRLLDLIDKFQHDKNYQQSDDPNILDAIKGIRESIQDINGQEDLDNLYLCVYSE